LKLSSGLQERAAFFSFSGALLSRRYRHYTVYVLLATRPPVPVQLVWKKSPRGLSTRS